MERLKYAQLAHVPIKGHAELNERWVQGHIAEDPSILGLGDVILKDKERPQPHAGRLDLLLQDAESTRRYEVEIQLGRTDESHIIRTIEYWDIERKRYPQYEHTAVIIAEDITSRFLNVINLFNGVIPLMAVQMKAVKIGDQIGLMFTTVLDQVSLGLVDEDEEIQEVTDRPYWEKRGTPTTLQMVDKLFELLRTNNKDLEPKYNKFYIGLAENGRPNNFVIFKPKKSYLNLEIRLKKSVDLEQKMETGGLDPEYDHRYGRYRFKIGAGEEKRYGELLSELFSKSYTEYGA